MADRPDDDILKAKLPQIVRMTICNEIGAALDAIEPDDFRKLFDQLLHDNYTNDVFDCS
jgi:hypothetical protein